MNAIIEQHQAEIADLCRRYRVRRLELFGSAATERFDPETSDFDFIVEFMDADDDPRIHIRFIEFADALERLLGRKADLLFDRALKPRFREYIRDQRQVVYEAADRTIAA